MYKYLNMHAYIYLLVGRSCWDTCAHGIPSTSATCKSSCFCVAGKVSYSNNDEAVDEALLLKLHKSTNVALNVSVYDSVYIYMYIYTCIYYIYIYMYKYLYP